MLRICSAGLYLAFIDVRTLCALCSAIINQEIIEFFGKETVSVKAGSFETHIVEIQPLDGQPGGGKLNICVEAPRCVVRNDAQLPAAMGGGKMLMELTSIGDMTSK